MTMPVQAEQEALRRAARSCDFVEAQSSVGRYVAALESALPQLPPAQAAELLRDACKLIEWSRRSLCAGRARLRDELLRVHRLSTYHGAGQPVPAHTWRIDG